MNCNSETEEETVAVQKKRARRVSFAENTSVHIFDRDDEYETPPDPKPSSADVNPTELGLFNEELGFRRDSSDGKGFFQNEEEDDEEFDDIAARGSFLRPMESPSSGSGFGSATSNDEDNFFGPVSASFIRPGRLSDSAPSDEFREVTMDSTAFSMNFRSLAKSDSGGDLLTSTGVHLNFEEKTPTQDSVSINQGSTMVLAVAKRPNLQSSTSHAKGRSIGDSNDMSLVGEIPYQYDYGKLSPGLNKLLAETNKDVSASDDISHLMPLRNIGSTLSPTNKRGSPHINIAGDENKETVGNNIHDRPTSIVLAEKKLSTFGCSTLSNLDNKLLQLSGQEGNSPLISSTSSYLTKQKQLVDGSFSLPKSSAHVTPIQKQSSYFVSNDARVHGASASSIQKSISKLESLAYSPFSTTLSAKIGSSRLRSLHCLLETPEDKILEKHSKLSYATDADNLINSSSGAQSSTIVQERGGYKISPYNLIAGNQSVHQQRKDTDLALAAPIWSAEQIKPHISSSEDPSVPFKTDSSMMDIADCKEDKRATDTPHNLPSTAEEKMEGKSSNKSANDPSIRKNLVELFAQSPSGNEVRNVNHGNSIHPTSIEEEVYSNANQLTPIENSFTRKRSNKEIEPPDEIIRTERSPKLYKGGLGDPVVMKPLSGSDGGVSISDYESKHWVDIQSKISENTKNLLSTPADKLNLRSIDVLDDILAHLLRARTYQMLCAEMHFQKAVDPLSNDRHKRVAEVKLLVQKLVQDQAKLQLMRVKREILLNKVQLVRSGIQESQMLKSNHSIVHHPKSTKFYADVHPQHIDCRQHQSAHEKITDMRQGLEDSEKKIKALAESLHMHCEIEGEPGSADTVVLVNEYLTRRKRSRCLRLDMQLWDVDHLESRTGHQSIILNYLGFIMQRLHVTSTPVSVISVSNELNRINITKNLPCVDAYAAFAYVFNAQLTRKYIGPRSLAEETQISSFLLGNILDVVDEVQLARLELPNLIETTFCSQSVEQLDLQLCFINFKSGRKAIFTFKLSCLKRGIYPSEILPSEMEAPADETQNSCPQQLLADVRAAFRSLKVGHFRIIRACRCISQIVEDQAVRRLVSHS